MALDDRPCGRDDVAIAMAYLELIGVWISGPRDEPVPTNTATPIDLPRGSDVVLGFTLVDSLGQPVELDLLGSDKLVFTARQPLGGPPLFAINASLTSSPGAYNFTIPSNTTIDFSGRLIYDVWATRAGAQQQVMFPAYLNLTPRMRNP